MGNSLVISYIRKRLETDFITELLSCGTIGNKIFSKHHNRIIENPDLNRNEKCAVQSGNIAI